MQHSSTSDPRQPRLSTTSAAARRPGTAEPSLRQQRSTGSIGSHRYVLSPKNGNGPLFRPQSAAPSSRDPLPLSTSDDEEDARQKQQEQEDRMRAHEQVQPPPPPPPREASTSACCPGDRKMCVSGPSVGSGVSQQKPDFFLWMRLNLVRSGLL